MATVEQKPIGKSRLLYQLNRTSLLIGKKVKKPLLEHGLSIISVQILEMLVDRKPGTVYPSMIARETGRVRHDISGVIERMKRDGLIAYSPNQGDRRSFVIDITPKGTEIYNKVKELPGKLEADAYSALTAKQRTELGYLLDKLQEKLE